MMQTVFMETRQRKLRMKYLDTPPMDFQVLAWRFLPSSQQPYSVEAWLELQPSQFALVVVENGSVCPVWVDIKNPKYLVEWILGPIPNDSISQPTFELVED